MTLLTPRRAARINAFEAGDCNQSRKSIMGKEGGKDEEEEKVRTAASESKNGLFQRSVKSQFFPSRKEAMPE